MGARTLQAVPQPGAALGQQPQRDARRLLGRPLPERAPTRCTTGTTSRAAATSSSGRACATTTTASRTARSSSTIPAVHPTATGDGLIVMQYAQVTNNDTDRAYCTTGIQNLDGTGGITYTYYNRYAPGARTLAAGRAIAFVPTANVGADALTVAPDGDLGQPGGRRQTVVPVEPGRRRRRRHGPLLLRDRRRPPSPWVTFTPGSGPIAAGASDDRQRHPQRDRPGRRPVPGRAHGVLHRRARRSRCRSTCSSASDAGRRRACRSRSRSRRPIPNPFNPRTVLSFALPAAGPVQLVVHDLTGRRLAVLVDEVRAAGTAPGGLGRHRRHRPPRRLRHLLRASDRRRRDAHAEAAAGEVIGTASHE